MSSDNNPMSAGELREIRAWFREGADRWKGDEVEPVVWIVNRLLDEVGRQGAELLAWRKIGQTVMEYRDNGYGVCWLCGEDANIAAYGYGASQPHKDNCPTVLIENLLENNP